MNSTHHNILQYNRLALATLTLTKDTAKTCAAPKRTPNNPYKITTKYETKRDTYAMKTEISPTKLPFLTQIAAHVPNAYTTRPAEPLTSIEPTKLMSKSASQDAQGTSSHNQRS
jgi:hypothetical protein